jgi:hypothetical protein
MSWSELSEKCAMMLLFSTTFLNLTCGVNEYMWHFITGVVCLWDDEDICLILKCNLLPIFHLFYVPNVWSELSTFWLATVHKILNCVDCKELILTISTQFKGEFLYLKKIEFMLLDIPAKFSETFIGCGQWVRRNIFAYLLIR